jgi:hypothetical protein
MACYTAVEDLTAAEFHDDECIEVRNRAVTTVKESLANHPRVVANEGQSPRADPEKDGFLGPGTSAAARRDSNAELRFPPPGRAVTEWGSCQVAEVK